MNGWRLLSTAVLLVLLVYGPALGDVSYSGSLTTYDGGIGGQEYWVDPGPTTIEWFIEWQESANAWHYSYTFSVPRYAISHMIIEVSDDFKLDDIWNVDGQHTEISLDTYTELKGNPGMPGFIYGIKLDNFDFGEEEGLVANLSFHTRRNPVWADFYAKCGGGSVQNAAWNMGLTDFEDDDPQVPPRDGSVNNHILAPNSYIPEPATTVLFGLGLAGLIGARYRRRAT